MRRYEDVEGCVGDDPADPSLYKHERDWTDDRPTLAEAQADDRELRAMRRYDDGQGL